MHVVAGLIFDQSEQNRLLIAKRPEDKPYGGLWEFPGGKVEKNESTQMALKRELFEEIGIEIIAAEAFLQTEHVYPEEAYPERTVFLDVWRVTKFLGLPQGKEGQQIRWVDVADICNYTFPTANRLILNRLMQFRAA